MSKDEAAFSAVGKKCIDAWGGVAQNKLGAHRGAVADAQPDDLRRAA
jgi:hypothetical protein